MHVYLGDVAGLVSDHHHTAGINKANPNLPGGEFSLQFVENATSVKHNKVKHTKTRCAFIRF